jgi:hypothetical protein
MDYNFPSLRSPTTECYFLSFEAAAGLQKEPFTIVETSRLVLLENGSGKKSSVDAVQTPSAKPMDISGITSCADNSFSDVSFASRVLDISQISTVSKEEPLELFSPPLAKPPKGNKLASKEKASSLKEGSTKETGCTQPLAHPSTDDNSAIASSPATTKSSNSVTNTSTTSMSSLTPSKERLVRLRVAGPSNLNLHLEGATSRPKRSELTEADQSSLAFFKAVYPSMKEIGWGTEDWHTTTIPLNEVTVYRCPEWDGAKLKERIEVGGLLVSSLKLLF